MNCKGCGNFWEGCNCDEAEAKETLKSSGDSTGLLLSQFLVFMQNKSIWPCHLFIGDDPQQLDPSEVIALKNEFKVALHDS